MFLPCSRFRGVKATFGPLRIQEKQINLKNYLFSLTRRVLVRISSIVSPANTGNITSAQRCEKEIYVDAMRRNLLNSSNICSLERNYFEAGKRIRLLVVWGLGHQSPIAPYLDIYSYVYCTV